MDTNRFLKSEHEGIVKTILCSMPNEQAIDGISAIFKALSEPSRVKILIALSYGELCVDHIVEAVQGNQSAVSHQLKTLKDNRIIKSRRVGKNILYSVADWHVLTMLNVAREHSDCHD